MKKYFVCALILSMLLMSACGQQAEDSGAGAQPPAGTKSNILTTSVAWKQTAAEYEALYYQAFNIAKLRVDQALQEGSEKPLAIVTDVDDTLVLHDAYWGRMVSDDKEFFDDPVWDEYVADNKMKAAPGASELLNYCKDNNVEVFYVTNRDQGENTYQIAVDNLNTLNFPYVDTDHLIVQIDTSNKEEAQQKIAEKYNIIVYMGDNLNDFQRKYYVTDIEERKTLMAEDKALYGEKFILLPNPTDGHWIRAIFGESEPAESDENRAGWKNAATTFTWEK